MSNSQNNDNGHEQRIPGGGDFASASAVDRGPLVKKCVARVWHDHGPGSGVLLPGNWFLTNHHVLPTPEKAKEAVAQFNYERQAGGKFSQMKQYSFDPDAGFHTSPVTDGDDWTVVKLKGDANADIGEVTLEDVAPSLNEIVNIIQHPDAGPRQFAQGAIIEVVDAPRRIRYLVNTLPGSSGSPVFNGNWQVVGLHHSAAESRNKKTAESTLCNEGIHIAALLDGLKQVGVWPHQPASGDYKRPDGTWIIEREADREALKHLRKLRITVALKGGRQMGKGLIADRIGKQLTAEGWQLASIDLRNEFADADYETGHHFLRQLAEKVTNQINSDPAFLAVFDHDGTPTAFRTFLEKLKVDRSDYRLLLSLDRMDTLAGRKCCPPVLSALRVIHGAQRLLQSGAWFQMLISHTITPRQIAAQGSIFDVGQIVEVDDFSVGELQKLAARYAIPGIDVTRLKSFLGGHPKLSEAAFLAMLEDDANLDEIIANSTTGGIFKQHLDQMTKEFRDLPDAKQLANSFRALLQGKPLDSEETFDALLALGVVKGTYSGDAVVRCELYKAWLPPRIPK